MGSSIQFLFLLMLALANRSVAAPPLRFGFSLNNSPPLIFLKYDGAEPTATGGIVYDMAKAISKELRRDAKYISLPRARMYQELKDGNIDLICHSSPDWIAEMKDQFKWSELVYSYGEVIVSTEKIPYSSLAEMSAAKTGSDIGTVALYIYPTLDTLFASKKFRRDDSFSIEQSLYKLIRGRYDYMIMSEFEYGYYKKLYPQLTRSSFQIYRFDTYCAVSKNATLAMEDLNKAISRLKKHHFFEKQIENIKVEKNVYGLRYLINTSYSPPFVYIDPKLPGTPTTEGILKTFGIILSEELKFPFQWIETSADRVKSSASEGAIDLFCFTNENWYPFLSESGAFQWSIPLMQHQDVIATSDNSLSVKYLEALPPGMIGTIFNYHYPSLNPLIKKGILTRVDARTMSLNIEKLLRKELKYVIIDKVEFRYYKERYPALRALDMIVDPVEMKCALSKKAGLGLEELNEAIKELRKKNKIDEIVDKEIARP